LLTLFLFSWQSFAFGLLLNACFRIRFNLPRFTLILPPGIVGGYFRRHLIGLLRPLRWTGSPSYATYSKPLSFGKFIFCLVSLTFICRPVIPMHPPHFVPWTLLGRFPRFLYRPSVSRDPPSWLPPQPTLFGFINILVPSLLASRQSIDLSCSICSLPASSLSPSLFRRPGCPGQLAEDFSLLFSQILVNSAACRTRHWNLLGLPGQPSFHPKLPRNR